MGKLKDSERIALQPEVKLMKFTKLLNREEEAMPQPSSINVMDSSPITHLNSDSDANNLQNSMITSIEPVKTESSTTPEVKLKKL